MIHLIEPGEPVRRHRAGASGSNLSFQDIMSGDPSAASAWAQIQTQLQAENAAGLVPPGTAGTLLTTAQGDFAAAYNGLNDAHADVSQIVGAAQQYTVQARSVLGAVGNIAGFISAAGNPNAPPQALVSSFTGILIGITVAAGAVSAGVGAAVVGAVTILLDAANAAGFFPTPPQGQALCDGSVHVVGGPTNFIIGCVVADYTNQNDVTIPGPQDNRWRSFPVPTNAADALWFQVINTGSGGVSFAQPIYWGGGQWSSGTNGPRMIDAAFPQYRQLECEQQLYDTWGWAAAPKAFAQAYFQAWKLNATLLLNGQKAATDLQVLQQLVATWNLAHESGGDFTIQPVSTYTSSVDAATSCSAVTASYVEYLAHSWGGPLIVHGGALKNPPKTLAVTNAVPGPATAASGSGATLAKVGLGLGVAALAGIGIYAHTHKISYTDAADRVLQRARAAFSKFYVRR